MDSLTGLLPNIGGTLIPVGSKCPSDFMVVTVASSVALGVFISFEVMVLLSMRVWRTCLSSPSNNELELLPTLVVVISHSQAQCQGHSGSQGPWCRRLSSPLTGWQN